MDESNSPRDNDHHPTDQNHEQQQQLNTETSRGIAAHLLTRCNHMLSEIDALQTLLAQTLRNPQLVEVRTLRSSIVSELRTLETLSRKIEAAFASSTADDSDEETEARYVHALRSSNLPFYEALWLIAKRSCTGLVAFGKRFYWEDGKDFGEGHDVRIDEDEDTETGEEKRGEMNKKRKKGAKKLPNQDKRKSVLVDIVADDGGEWVKVSTISESRLLFEMAEKGWEKDSDDEEGQGRTILRNYADEDEGDEDDKVGLIRLANDMRRAANATRVRYKHPQIRFVLPRIDEGVSSDIADLFNTIRGYGIIVESGEGYLSGSQMAGVKQKTDLSHLLPSHFQRLTPSLNVDCTLLLAMISDLSHYKSILPSSEHHSAINRQIEIEKEHPLLPVELWPATVDRELLCTDEAAKRMREIVDTIGTDDEKTRTQILMGDHPFVDLDANALIEKFQELSDYQVPSQWRLPIKVVAAKHVIDSGRKQGKLPEIVDKVPKTLSDINYSVFLYGWVTGIVTISSNRTVVRQIEVTVEKHRGAAEDLEGPSVWVCDTPRSLIGKEKDRRE